MKYFFMGKIEKKENYYCIRIPFNVWEVCKQREIIQADLVLNNKSLDCELIPEEKGNYTIHLREEDVAPLDCTQTHRLLLHIGSSLIKMDPNSPYDFKHPIRKIDHMDLILQPKDGLCGQTCVAMLAGVTLDDVIRVMNCHEWQATMGRVISALNYYGIDHSDVIMYTGATEVSLPKCCIMMEKMGRYCHYLVHYDGKFYDPTLGVSTEYDKEQLLGYLEIKTE